MNNKRTMKFLGIDDWNRPVYQSIETKSIWKDINCGEGKTDLYSSNCFDGEPDCSIKKSLEITFIDEYKVNPYKFEYMMLSRLQSDCEAHLGISNRKIDNCKNHINEMKRLYNLLPEKPQWLTYKQIEKYEKLMCV